MQASQPQAWAALCKTHGPAQAREELLDRLRASLDKRGTLDVLRTGIELLGVKQRVELAVFKPAMGLNAEVMARYGANRLRHKPL